VEALHILVYFILHQGLHHVQIGDARLFGLLRRGRRFRSWGSGHWFRFWDWGRGGLRLRLWGRRLRFGLRYNGGWGRLWLGLLDRSGLFFQLSQQVLLQGAADALSHLLAVVSRGLLGSRMLFELGGGLPGLAGLSEQIQHMGGFVGLTVGFVVGLGF